MLVYCIEILRVWTLSSWYYG